MAARTPQEFLVELRAANGPTARQKAAHEAEMAKVRARIAASKKDGKR